MAAPVQIQAIGLKEIRRDFKQVGDKASGTALRKANKGAAELVAKGAQASAAGSRMGHVAAGSIKPRATQSSASVVAGQNVPWFAGHNFGSRRYGQFPPPRKPDYHLWSTVEREGNTIVEEYAKALDEVLRTAGLL